MNTLQINHLQEAIALENRGFKKEARYFYNKLISDISSLDVPALTRVALFYQVSSDALIVYNSAKLAIKKGGDVSLLLPKYLESWEVVNKDLSQLEWLDSVIHMDFHLREQIIISKYYFDGGKIDKAYVLLIDANEKLERKIRDDFSDFHLYAECILSLIEIEYEFKNYTQARFHLRKLIHLNQIPIKIFSQLTYWSILLDEITVLMSHADWKELMKTLDGDMRSVIEFYDELACNQISKRTISIIRTVKFQDYKLEKKRLSYKRLIKKITKQVDWYAGIEEEWMESDKDLLIVLLYADYLKIKKPEQALEFWNSEFQRHADRKEAIKAYSLFMHSKIKSKDEALLNDCSVTFFGGGEKIGGTSILLSINDSHLLLDAGMHINEETYYPDYTPLFEAGLNFADIDALLVSHAHMDHTGAIPYVHSQRSDLPVFATEPTVQLMKVLLNDAVRINKEGQENIYSELDVYNTLHSIKSIEFNVPFYISSKNKKWKITYFQAGHILGAGSIHIEFEGVSVLFTGDYSIDEQKTVEGLRLPEDLCVDILITESTYGYLPSNASISREKQEQLLIESLKQTVENKGTMLIPAFAVGRAQEIVRILKEEFQNLAYLPFDLFLDGRVIDVCNIYEDFSEQNKYVNPKLYSRSDNRGMIFGNGVQSAQDIYSNKKNSRFKFDDFFTEYIAGGNNCIVASSGMLTDSSSSARYAEKLISNSNNSISFTGYMDEGSPGQRVLQSVKRDIDNKVLINGTEKNILARIESFRLSAHASREQIVQLILKLQPQKVFLMHGEHEKEYKPIPKADGNKKIYPTIIDLLGYSDSEIEVIPAFNGEKYVVSTKG